MNWVGLHIRCSEDLREILLAELSQLSFSTFEETDDGLDAYCEKQNWDEVGTLEILKKYNIFDFNSTQVEQINWNEEWEKNYDPIIIGDLCRVRAVFHEPSSLPYEIIINPKMSFGTGHHATTHLVLEYQLELDHSGMNVLDVGCGTGVLAIMAHKRGASTVEAFDIEEWCVENSKENFSLNNCRDIKVGQYELGEAKRTDYDLILSNITKTFHLDLMGDYKSRMSSGALLVMSGFYDKDVQDILKAAKRIGFEFVESKTRKEWARLVCRIL